MSETSPFITVEKGSQLALNQDIRFPPQTASIYIQDGNLKSRRDIDIYKPNCVFEKNTLSDDSVIIEKDTFIITKVVEDTLSVSLKTQRVASIGVNIGIGFSFADGPSDFNFSTTMYLKSPKNPDILRISCMHWDSSSDGDYLTIDQIRRTLGNIFTLKRVTKT